MTLNFESSLLNSIVATKKMWIRFNLYFFIKTCTWPEPIPNSILDNYKPRAFIKIVPLSLKCHDF